MRVGILALLHESNTFVHQPTTLEHFECNLLAEGEAVRTSLADAPHETGGFFAGLAEAGVQAVPLFAARATPHGVITAQTWEHLVGRLLACLNAAGPLDGLLVAPHGATVSEAAADADGDWLTRVRTAVGPTLPIVGTLDLHANVSPAMVTACNALIAYRSNPHLDQRQVGEQAARLLVRTLRGEIRPSMAAAFPPLAINIERQLTTEEPCRSLYALADEQLRRPGVLSNSLLLGFPYADVAEMGACVLTVTDNDPALAQRLANELAEQWWQRRHAFIGQLHSPEEAVREAAKLPGPVGLLDMGDNVGGGSPGDGTILAHEVLRAAAVPAVVCLNDPQAVQQCQAVGAGQRLPLSVGGKADDRHGPPLHDTFTVVSLHEGTFTESLARHGGYTHFDQGPTAVVRSEAGLTVLLTSRRTAPVSSNQLTAFGLDPATFQVIILKGVHAPVAAYAPLCSRLIRVNTPGVTTADMGQLTYQHRRRPLFPFELDTAWHAKEGSA
jgi:microcystin degradation protein MlrC